MITYYDKLRDPRWQKKRLEVFSRDDWKCKKCGETNEELVVHHLDYVAGRDPWDYEDENFMTLCINCHDREHDIEKSFQIKNILAQHTEYIERKISEKIIGISTGFKDLDLSTNGLQNGDLIVLTSLSSIGKSMFSLNILQNIAVRTCIPSLFISLDKPKEEIATKLLCLVAKRPLSRRKEEQEAIKTITKKLEKAPVFIDDTTDFTTQRLLQRIRRYKNEKDVGCVIIDFLELISSNKFEMLEISRLLKILARDLNIPIILIAKCNKDIEKRREKDLKISDPYLKDLDFYSDLIVGIKDASDQLEYGDQMHAGSTIIDIIILKNKNGPLDYFKMVFRKNYGSFHEINRDEYETNEFECEPPF